MAKRRVFVEALDRHIVLGGCKLSRHDPAGLRLRDFIHAATAYPTSPPTCDYSAQAMSIITDVEGNDTLGDCVIAEDAHYIAVVTGNSGNGLYSYSDAQTIADYSAITGYTPADPNSDQGTDPIADLNYRATKGYADGSKDAGWALVDATNQAEVEYAINTFGNLKMWFGIPDSIANALPSASGFVWDVTAGAPDPNNGHCIGAPGYNSPRFAGVTAQGPLVMTWGMLGIVTWAALAAWFTSNSGGGLAVRATTDWVSKATGNTPSGLNLSALITAFDLNFGGKIPVPTPITPPPAPPPVPGTSVTPAQAISWAQAGIPANSWLLTRQQALTDIAAGINKNWKP
jgi:hypothetical protein